MANQKVYAQILQARTSFIINRLDPANVVILGTETFKALKNEQASFFEHLKAMNASPKIFGMRIVLSDKEEEISFAFEVIAPIDRPTAQFVAPPAQ